ncbi:GNAT family N-acetyltransferase [Chryseobacterium indoltheticum]|uniref:GNAT family N-acetyltransferase n=1 Tax=Chryseobacterium indoltheticum TaxID=254 RepID=UPI003F49944E
MYLWWNKTHLTRIWTDTIKKHCIFGQNRKTKPFWLIAEFFDKGIKYHETSIGRVLTSEKGRGKNLGKQLIQYAVETIENRFNTSEVRISAQDYLLRFYSGFGFKETDKKYLEDNIPHTEMFRK